MSQNSKALSYLEKSLSSGMWKAGDRLPGLRELAKAVGVSTFPMRQAIKQLVQKGILSIEERSGIWVLPLNEQVSPLLGKRAEKWKQVQTHLAKDLFSGVLNSSQPLPSLQELRHRYGTSFPILKKALSSLENQGLVTLYKKTYTPNFIVEPGYKTKILFLVESQSKIFQTQGKSLIETGLTFDHRVEKFYPELEKLCIKKNLSSDMVAYILDNDTVHFIDPIHRHQVSIDTPQKYYGIILFKTSFHSNEFQKLLITLSGLGKPLVVVDDSEMLDWKLPRMKNKNVRIFSIGHSQKAGMEVGRFLLELGHRNVAYISPVFEDGWTKNRYLAICKSFEFAGISDKVKLYINDSPNLSDENNVDNKVNELFSNMPSLAEYLEKSNLISPEQLSRFDLSTRQVISGASSLLKKSIFLYPVFESLLKNGDITAWIGSDDWTALAAMDFLYSKGISVPEQISVIGIDDYQPHSISIGLSTYDYDIPGIVQAVLGFISNPTIFPANDLPFIECCGHVVPRKSTGPARKEIGV